MTHFRRQFGNNKNELPVVADRYHLIAGAFCPFAHRAIIARELLGLEDAISLDYVAHTNTPEGLSFSDHENGKDNVYSVTHLSAIYKNTVTDYEGPFTVPILTDKTTGTIVIRESAEILHEFATTFSPLHREDAPTLYPEHLRAEIDEWDAFIGKYINSGIYRIGLAKSQEEYEKGFNNFFGALDKIEEHLATSRYIAGTQLTEVDVKFYTTMVRFDVVYYGLYKATRNRLVDFPNIWNYMRELYQTRGFGSTTNFEAIKQGYYTGTGGEKILKSANVIPIGPNTDHWNEPHTRHNI